MIESGYSDERMNIRQRICWLYAYDHRRDTILLHALRSLAVSGYEVFLMDRLTSRVASQYYNHIPLGRRLWRLGKPLFLLELSLAVARLRPIVLLTSMPDVAAAAWFSWHRHGTPIIYYPFELFGEEVPGPQSLGKRFWMRIERLLLRYVIQGLIVPNRERGEIYRVERGSRVEPVIVRNCAPYATYERQFNMHAKLGLSRSQRIVLYHGTFMSTRCLEQLIAASRLFPEDAVLVLMGQINGYWRNHLEPMIQQDGIAGRVLHFPWVSPDAVMQYVADADVGVVIYGKSTRNNYFCAPTKLHEFIMAGVPIVGSNWPYIRQIVDEYGIGVCFDPYDPASIASAVATVLAEPREAWNTRLESARQDLNWENEAKVFCSYVGHILNAGRRSMA